MGDIDAVGRCFLAIVAVCTLVVATTLEVKTSKGSTWGAVAVAVVWTVPWLVGGALALFAAAGSVPW